ncbi:MAG: putative toxin-antitoxin system toxin component, PIN family [Gammaproteobacteria bacterium]|nr:putative toxin-antitoxin system toxin component, PIN family [Gammaproteobacteria bacterium]
MNNSIVIDTSVLINALLGPGGPDRELIRLCLQGHYKPLISNTLFLEYEDVISRSHILEPCPLTPNELRELLNAYYSICEWVPIYYLWRPNLPDEGDNFLIELAVAGNAYCVVTNNVRDIKTSELIFPGLHIMTPEQFLRG